MKPPALARLPLVLLALGIGITACHATSPVAAPETTPTATLTPTATPLPVEQKVITIWHDWPGDYEEAYTLLAEAYTAAHPEIHIELVKTEKLNTALSAELPPGEGPDIVRWQEYQISSAAQRGMIVPLDDFISQETLQQTFEPAAAQAMLWNGSIWGIPEMQDGIALIYNRDMLTAADLPAPDDFEELLAKATAFRQTHPDKYYLCNQGLGSPDAYHVAPIFLGFGLQAHGGFINELGQANLTLPEAYAAAEWIKAFSRAAPAVASPGICQAMFIEGQAAIWWTGPRALRSLQHAGMNVGIAPMGSPLVDVRLFMLTRLAVERGNAGAAFAVMEYFGSAEVQKQLTLRNSTIPANSAALASPEVRALKTVATFGAALHRGTPMANHPYADCPWGPVGDAVTAIWSGVLTPAVAVEQAQASLEACAASIRGR
ncbi:MAG TPA: extracellular solute-binding protein [Anaerolineae bacterium]|nr:extracellular solute-binding protein [Anaerolineae bacterium]HQJ10480.1 extracellular solute-binding protein [Anaerolineae bacterium]